MNKRMGLFFFLKKSKVNAVGFVPIYLRITIEGLRTDISSKRWIDPAKWNNQRQKVIGSSEEVRSINSCLKALEVKTHTACGEMLDKNLSVTSAGLKSFMFDKWAPPIILPEKTISGVFSTHNREIKSLIGKGFAKGTVQRYETSYSHTAEFVKWKYQTDDLALKNIDHEFVTRYVYYLRSVRNCANNSTVKYVKNFKKIVLICLANGWMEKNPFLLYKVKLKKVVREFLNMVEIQRIAEHDFKFNRLRASLKIGDKFYYVLKS